MATVQSLGEHKRGDYFSFYATLEDASGSPIVLDVADMSSQVRDKYGRLYNTLTITADPIVPGRYLLEAEQTLDWPVDKTLEIDIEMQVSPGKPLSSPTFTVLVVKDVTRSG